MKDPWKCGHLGPLGISGHEFQVDLSACFSFISIFIVQIWSSWRVGFNQGWSLLGWYKKVR